VVAVVVAVAAGVVALAVVAGLALAFLPDRGSDDASAGGGVNSGTSSAAQVSSSGGTGPTSAAGGYAGASSSAGPTATPSAATVPVTSTTGPSASPAPPQPAETATRMADYVRAHYADLPDDPAAAWSRLTPRYQGAIGGYAAYHDFWSTVAATTVDQVSADPDAATVTFRLGLSYADGRSGSETRIIQLVRAGEGYRIDSAELV